jgi:hypothetical protein
MGEVAVTIGPKPVDRGLDKGLDADDPYALVGVPIPVEPGVDPDQVLALAFVEEFALAGWRPDRIRSLFADPNGGKAHEIWQRRGAVLVDRAVAEVFGAERPDPGGPA